MGIWGNRGFELKKAYSTLRRRRIAATRPLTARLVFVSCRGWQCHFAGATHRLVALCCHLAVAAVFVMVAVWHLDILSGGRAR